MGMTKEMDYNTPLVSVIVPIFNAERYLTECLDSILAQTYENIEVICVDDGSTDDSHSILLGYEQKDFRVKIISQKNCYAGVARNVGFEESSGKYCMFLDADDVFEPELIKRMVLRMEEMDADVVITKGIGFDDMTGLTHKLFAKEIELKKISTDACFSKNDIPDYIFQITDTWVWDKMYRSDFVRENEIRFQETRVINDALFCCVAYAEAERIAVVDDYLIRHRTNVKTSIEYTRAPYWQCAFEMFDRLREELDRRGLYEELLQSYLNVVADRIIYYVMTINDASCFKAAYSYYKEEAEDKYNLATYDQSVFHDEYVYEKLTLLKKSDSIGYLCASKEDLKMQGIKQNRAIWWLEEQKKWLEEAKCWSFPIKNLKKNTRLIIYGYGDVGKDYCNEIDDTGLFEISGVIDKNGEFMKADNPEIPFVTISEAVGLNYDYLIIAIANKAVADNVKSDLLERGFDADKIRWFDPLMV